MRIISCIKDMKALEENERIALENAQKLQEHGNAEPEVVEAEAQEEPKPETKKSKKSGSKKV